MFCFVIHKKHSLKTNHEACLALAPPERREDSQINVFFSGKHQKFVARLAKLEICDLNHLEQIFCRHWQIFIWANSKGVFAHGRTCCEGLARTSYSGNWTGRTTTAARGVEFFCILEGSDNAASSLTAPPLTRIVQKNSAPLTFLCALQSCSQRSCSMHFQGSFSQTRPGHRVVPVFFVHSKRSLLIFSSTPEAFSVTSHSTGL